MLFLMLFYVNANVWAAPQPPTVRELAFRLASEIEESGKGSEWLTERAHISPLERSLLRSDPRLPRSTRPKIRVKPKGLQSASLLFDGVEVDLMDLPRGRVLVNGKSVTVNKNFSVYELAAMIAGAPYLKESETEGPKSSEKKTFLLPWISPALAEPPQAITRGCASKDYFTYVDVVHSPFGFAPPIWISAAVISIARWAGNQFRSCSQHVVDLQEILRRNRIAIRHLHCGSDQWGTDREIEFWVDELDEKGKNRTARFDLDYNNYFAVERSPERENAFREERSSTVLRPLQRLYVFGEKQLKEVRVLEDKGKDFLGGCRSLRDTSRERADREAFVREQSRMEPFRQIFSYMGRHNTCTACPGVETQVLSPRPPSFFRTRASAPPEALTPAATGPQDSSQAR